MDALTVFSGLFCRRTFFAKAVDNSKTVPTLLDPLQYGYLKETHAPNSRSNGDERYCFSTSLDNEHCFIVNTVLFTNLSQTIVLF